MNNVANKGKEKNIIIILLSILLIVTLGFICYDKFLHNEKPTNSNCNCPKCEKCSTEDNKVNDKENEICELDMKDKTELDVYYLCEEKGISNPSNVKIRNISINDKTYTLYHNYEPFYDSKGTYIKYNGITKLYLNGILIDIYKGENRETLWKIKIDNNSFIISETWPSETPPADYKYDLNNIKTYEGSSYYLEDLK